MEQQPPYPKGVAQKEDEISNNRNTETNSSREVAAPPKEALTPAERRQFWMILKGEGFRGKDRTIKFKAKEKGVTPEELLAEMRAYAKSQIRFPEKVKHFHRTSFDALDKITDARALLSRSEIKKRNPEARLPGWSASDDVMMTFDQFDDTGKLYKRGLTSNNVGASGNGLTLVLEPSIMRTENYDAILEYPTVSNAPIEGNCQTILVTDEADKLVVESILRKAALDSIHVELQSEWEKKHYEAEKA